MKWVWDDYSANSGTPTLALLLSQRTQQLLLAAITNMDFRSAWLTVDDASWDDIDAALGEAYYEVETVIDMSEDLTPVGAIVAFIGLIADIPAKWLPCDNSTYAQADYPELAALLKATFLSGSNFHTPNLQGHFIMGAVDDSDHSGETGANGHTLTIAELPAHHHVVPAHDHTFSSFNNAGAGAANVVASGSTGGASTKTSSTEAATDTSDVGSGTSFNTYPLNYRFHWIIKALP